MPVIWPRPFRSTKTYSVEGGVWVSTVLAILFISLCFTGCDPIELKAAIVAEDEREAGRRAILNFGHTFGHAIERCQGYGEWLHGEAVAAGICMAASFSNRIGWLDAADVERIRELFARLNLPVDPPRIDAGDFLAAMSLDKKVIAGEIRLVLLKSVGEAVVTADYPSHELVDLLSEQFIH